MRTLKRLEKKTVERMSRKKKHQQDEYEPACVGSFERTNELISSSLQRSFQGISRDLRSGSVDTNRNYLAQVRLQLEIFIENILPQMISRVVIDPSTLRSAHHASRQNVPSTKSLFLFFDSLLYHSSGLRVVLLFGVRYLCVDFFFIFCFFFSNINRE